MLTHLFFPGRKFGLGSGQFQTLAARPTLRIQFLLPHLKDAKKKVAAKGVAVRDIELLSTPFCTEFWRGPF